MQSSSKLANRGQSQGLANRGEDEAASVWAIREGEMLQFGYKPDVAVLILGDVAEVIQAGSGKGGQMGLRAKISDSGLRNGLHASLWQYTLPSCQRIEALRAEREARAILAAVEDAADWGRLDDLSEALVLRREWDEWSDTTDAALGLAEALAAFVEGE